MNDQHISRNSSSPFVTYRNLSLLMVTLSLLLAALPVQAQSTFRSQIYTAYIGGDMNAWERALKSMPAKVADNEALYEYALAHYGFIGYCLGIDQKDRARSVQDKTEELAGELLNREPGDPRFHALRGAVYGFQMGFQKHLIPVVGPKSLKAINRALEISPSSPEALIESGNKDWYMPHVFGGSKERAIRDYEKAIRLMDRDLDFQKENWYYLNVHMILAGWYNERGLTSRARGIYQKLLRIEPRFQWAQELNR